MKALETVKLGGNALMSHHVPIVTIRTFINAKMQSRHSLRMQLRLQTKSVIKTSRDAAISFVRD